MGRPIFHVTPRQNWMNDPNGFIYYRGEYHLFYQHYPFHPKWGTMHWGHKVSRDLVHWENLGVALYPSKAYDRNGCFSGSALEVDGRMQLYYTAIVYDCMNPEDITVSGGGLLASQAMISSPDGRNFDPVDKKLIVPQFDSNDSLPYGDCANVRDPKVWKNGDTYYMVLGSQHPDESGKMRGELLFYTSVDSINWTFANVFHSTSIDTQMFECPDLFQIGEQFVFITSPFGEEGIAGNYKDHAWYATGNFDHATCTLQLDSDLQLIDYGMDFYAPQTTTDEAGRRMMIGWLRMPQACRDASGTPWIGAFTLPRLVEIRNDHVCFPVHPAIRAAFQTPADTFRADSPSCIRIHAHDGARLNIGGFVITVENGIVKTSRSAVFGDFPNIGTAFETPQIEPSSENAFEDISLEIYVDDCIVEVYVNDGEYVISNICYHLTDEFTCQDAEILEILTL